MSVASCDSRGANMPESKAKEEKVSKNQKPDKVVATLNQKGRRKPTNALDNNLALYAARADLGAKKGEARRKNYFQVLDQYQTTVIGGATTIGGATAINDREDEEFAEKTREEMTRFLQDEKLIETRFEFNNMLNPVGTKFKKEKLKAGFEEYRRLEEAIGEDMMNILSKTENLDGTDEFKRKS
ncbi:hypothetical protein DICVIV_02921 [Dictyocaulus viviparus]|uniref:Uncharacterized protein n=1 Tax=Dictyocaulus viviparus TaxID=29172 RepID=A0A0D8Y2M8_DICVI|nr:hypothetical protein DICVIV_02921 [Dictyocaulus viviparus]